MIPVGARVWASVPGNAMEPPDGPFRGTVVEVIEDKSWGWGLLRYLVKFDEEIVFSNHGRLWLDPEFVQEMTLLAAPEFHGHKIGLRGAVVMDGSNSNSCRVHSGYVGVELDGSGFY